MSKIIIHNDAPMLSDYSAVHMVNQVIAGGKVSGDGQKKQYCHLTTFLDRQLNYTVTCSKREDTYTFRVWSNTKKPHP